MTSFKSYNHFNRIKCFTIIFILSIFLPQLINAWYESGTKGGGNKSRQCGMNAYWNNCATTCPDNCQNYGSFRACTLNCRQGCSCKRGFVLESAHSNRCIPIGHCPARKGGRNQNGRYQRNWRNWN